MFVFSGNCYGKRAFGRLEISVRLLRQNRFGAGRTLVGYCHWERVLTGHAISGEATMFELVLFAALSHTLAAPPGIPDFGEEAAPVVARPSDIDATAPPAFVDVAGISWRASVEAASAGEFERGAAFSPFARLRDKDTFELATGESPPLGGSYDALLAKRWHWFELYGVSRLHVVPKESRHPWWFSY